MVPPGYITVPTNPTTKTYRTYTCTYPLTKIVTQGPHVVGLRAFGRLGYGAAHFVFDVPQFQEWRTPHFRVSRFRRLGFRALYLDPQSI